jgi:hypothetical protein
VAADGEAGGDMAANVGTGADHKEVTAPQQPEGADGGSGHNLGLIGYWEELKGKAHHAVSWEAAWAAARAGSEADDGSSCPGLALGGTFDVSPTLLFGSHKRRGRNLDRLEKRLRGPFRARSKGTKVETI